MNTPRSMLRELLTSASDLPPVPVPSCSSLVTGQSPSVVSNEKTIKSKRHRVQHCAAVNCKRNRFDNPELSFFKFPKDEERSKR